MLDAAPPRFAKLSVIRNGRGEIHFPVERRFARVAGSLRRSPLNPYGDRGYRERERVVARPRGRKTRATSALRRVFSTRRTAEIAFAPSRGETFLRAAFTFPSFRHRCGTTLREACTRGTSRLLNGRTYTPHKICISQQILSAPSYKCRKGGTLIIISIRHVHVTFVRGRNAIVDCNYFRVGLAGT